MFLIIRKISAYTNADIIIGIFSTLENANNAKEKYITQCKISDKWAEQSYKNVDLQTDILIEDINQKIPFEYSKSTKIIYVVSKFVEGFGQIIRFVDSFWEMAQNANEYCEIKNEAPEEDYEGEFICEKIEINKVYFDELQR